MRISTVLTLVNVHVLLLGSSYAVNSFPGYLSEGPWCYKKWNSNVTLDRSVFQKVLFATSLQRSMLDCPLMQYIILWPTQIIRGFSRILRYVISYCPLSLSDLTYCRNMIQHMVFYNNLFLICEVWIMMQAS